jgi:hypothetical protein
MHGCPPPRRVCDGAQTWKLLLGLGSFCLRGFVIAGVSAYLPSMPGSLILIDANMSAIDDRKGRPPRRAG